MQRDTQKSLERILMFLSSADRKARHEALREEILTQLKTFAERYQNKQTAIDLVQKWLIQFVQAQKLQAEKGWIEDIANEAGIIFMRMEFRAKFRQRIKKGEFPIGIKNIQVAKP